MKTLCLSFAVVALTAAASVPASVLTLGKNLARACFDAAEARDRGPNSIAPCDRALAEEALYPRDRSATLVNRGVLNYLGRRYASASRDFDEAIAVNPDEPEAWLNKAILSVQLEKSSAAFGLVDRALALKTRKPALAYYVRGIAHENAGNLRAAYADLVRARDLAPGWAEPQVELERYKVR